MATRMMTIHRFQLPGCFGVFAWFPPDGGMFVPLELAFVLFELVTLGLVLSVRKMVESFVWTMLPMPEKDGESVVSNCCVTIGSCAVAVGDDAFFLFLAGLDAVLFCPEIFWL